MGGLRDTKEINYLLVLSIEKLMVWWEVSVMNNKNICLVKNFLESKIVLLKTLG